MVYGCHGAFGATLRHHVACTLLTAAALGGDTQLHLDVIKIHTGAGMARNFLIRNPSAHADNHGKHSNSTGNGVIINENPYHLCTAKKIRDFLGIGLAALVGLRHATGLGGSVAHLRLQVVLQANFGNQFDLCFQKVDVFFGVFQDLLQQVA